ncbi:arylsulfatase [Dankookia sp. GCM10030260]|uniref:arylsulfatase B n=1 Tax=Dankookia sp. GCM10030260 TaxID=3273390 RepID=UPI0036223882
MDRNSETTPAAGGRTRRDMLLGGAAFAAAAGLGAGPGAGQAMAQPAKPARPPHIVYILSDDQGWKDVGFQGSDIRTPNIDRLAEGGAKLGQFYVEPMCTPSRAAFLTGRYPMRYGLQTGVIPAGATYGLAQDEYLLPQALKAAGYRTAMVGKWHVGHGKPGMWPRQRGFDSFYGALVGEIDHFKHSSHGVRDWYRDNKVVKEEGYDTTLFGQEAAKIIAGHDKARPLFLYLAFTAPHTPYQAPKAWLDKYAHIADPNRRAYAAQVSAMDDQIGRVVAALEKRGMRDDTLIVFHSDNGGTRSAMFTGDTPVKGEIPPDNAPLRNGKGTLYEGGTRAAAVMNWPGRIPAGKVDGLAHVVDMLPTLAGLAGAPLAKSKPLDGVDIWPLVTGKAPSPPDRDRLQRRALPRRGPPGRLEAAGRRPAAGAGRAVRPGEGPVGDHQPRRRQPRDRRPAAGADRRAGAGSRAAAAAERDGARHLWRAADHPRPRIRRIRLNRPPDAFPADREAPMRLIPIWTLAAALLPLAAAMAQQPIFYPSKGQSAEKQAQDEAACRSWATQQTGINPNAPAAPPPKQAGGRVRGAAAGATAAAITGNDAGKGAAVGAVAGGTAQRGARRQGARQASAQQQQAGATHARAVGACMEGRGYAVR